MLQTQDLILSATLAYRTKAVSTPGTVTVRGKTLNLTGIYHKYDKNGDGTINDNL
jgi:hypothetical protein